MFIIIVIVLSSLALHLLFPASSSARGRRRCCCYGNTACRRADDVSALRLAEGPEAAVHVPTPHGEVVRRPRHELRQRAGHGQGQSLHLADLLPVQGVAVAASSAPCRRLLVVRVEVVGVNGRAAVVRLGDAPREHDAVLALNAAQLELRLLRWGGLGGFRREASRCRGRGERRERGGGGRGGGGRGG